MMTEQVVSRPILTREVFQRMLGQILMVAGKDGTITAHKLGGIVVQATQAVDHRPYVHSLVTEGYLERVRGSRIRRNHYQLMQRVTEVVSQRVAPALLAPEQLERFSPTLPQSPGLQHIRELAQQLSAAIEAFDLKKPESGIREILALSPADLRGLKRVAVDTAELLENFNDTLVHFQEIADQLRKNRNLADPQS